MELLLRHHALSKLRRPIISEQGNRCVRKPSREFQPPEPTDTENNHEFTTPVFPDQKQ